MPLTMMTPIRVTPNPQPTQRKPFPHQHPLRSRFIRSRNGLYRRNVVKAQSRSTQRERSISGAPLPFRIRAGYRREIEIARRALIKFTDVGDAWAFEALEVGGSRARLAAVVVVADRSGIASLARASCSSVPCQVAAGCPDVGLELGHGLRETRQPTRRRCRFRFPWSALERSDKP